MLPLQFNTGVGYIHAQLPHVQQMLDKAWGNRLVLAHLGLVTARWMSSRVKNPTDRIMSSVVYILNDIGIKAKKVKVPAPKFRATVLKISEEHSYSRVFTDSNPTIAEAVEAITGSPDAKGRVAAYTIDRDRLQLVSSASARRFEAREAKKLVAMEKEAKVRRITLEELGQMKADDEFNVEMFKTMCEQSPQPSAEIKAKALRNRQVVDQCDMLLPDK